jgi:hypothetical protein
MSGDDVEIRSLPTTGQWAVYLNGQLVSIHLSRARASQARRKIIGDPDES